ncbi:hypothetical protein PISMIDRAFT_98060 [Pisolithus microcarpus 441]|uniref:Uncharacterized protein n=1 Tax=Pisolithus microcarpus 441 TaxID=765257 RepID=A0A0C9Z634_9AGAM|nr:hypothetical protein PISMIDRAFT_98060 [Pisolithus microcarpus 441]
MSKSLTLEDDNEILQSFSISLTVYTKVKKTIQGKTMSKEEKSAKMKELLFTINGLNYLEFLHSILFKHGLKDYEVIEKKHFPLKYIPLKAKGDAIDINNLSDYREMVAVASSPPIPSPSQLACFLQYAETNLGMCYAISYKSIFEMHGISPDILPDVDDKLLSEFGISPGDAICLKKGSMAWWNGPDANHKQSKASASALTEEAQQLPAK